MEFHYKVEEMEASASKTSKILWKFTRLPIHSSELVNRQYPSKSGVSEAQNAESLGEGDAFELLLHGRYPECNSFPRATHIPDVHTMYCISYLDLLYTIYVVVFSCPAPSCTLGINT